MSISGGSHIAQIHFAANHTLNDWIEIPVTEEIGDYSLQDHIQSILTPMNNFRFRLEDVIMASDRYLHISNGRTVSTPPPTQVLNNWLDMLRWEASHFWDVTSNGNVLIPRNTLAVTHEHRRRAAELLGCGISLLFSEQRLGVPRQQFYFFNHHASRPDFIFNLNRNFRSGVVFNQYQYGIESRMRKSQPRLNSSDHESLDKKKIASAHMAGIIAIYCFYGSGTHRNNAKKTRIHLADPPGDGQEISIEENAMINLIHYAGVCSRIGLWGPLETILTKLPVVGYKSYRKLEELLLPREKGVFDSESNAPHREVEPIRLEESSYLSSISSEQLEDERDTSSESSRNMKWGLNNKVLKFIETEDWPALAQFKDPESNVFEPLRENRYVTSDGVIRILPED